MRRFRVGGSYDSPLSKQPNTGRLNNNQRAANRNLPSDFYTTRQSNLRTVQEQLLDFICTYLGIGIPQNSQSYNNASVYDRFIWRLKAYGMATLRTAFGIFEAAPTEMNVYLPTFVAYDFLNIYANTLRHKSNTEMYLRLAGMIRSILPIVDKDNFSKWEEYYRDFKTGRYSGGMTKWQARKAAETRYDPVDPIFDFTKPPRVKVPHAGASELATSNALYFLDAPPPTATQLKTGNVDIIKGGFSRRAARSSRRRF